MIDFRADDLSGPEIGALLDHHFGEAHRNSPPGHAFVFDAARLRAPDIAFWSAWQDGTLLGCGALREFDSGWGEIKSMRTAPAHVGKGVGMAVLDHLIGVARGRGYTRVSLETGSGPAYAAALSLYRRRGFAKGPAFGGYAASDFNQFLHLDL